MSNPITPWTKQQQNRSTEPSEQQRTDPAPQSDGIHGADQALDAQPAVAQPFEAHSRDAEPPHPTTEYVGHYPPDDFSIRDDRDLAAQAKGPIRTQRGIGMLVGLAVAVVVLMAAGFLFTDHNHNNSTTTKRPMSNTTIIAATTFSIGKVTANDGATLTLHGLSGSTTTVHTDAKTRVLVLSGFRVSDVKTGDTVLVHGGKAVDGSIRAKLIVGGSIGLFGR